jgi:UDP-N-acetyl-D-glucosamine dehydrogenase
LVCLPTPLDANREPNLSILTSGVRDARPHLRPGALVVLEGTTYPGTTREVLLRY